VTYRRLGTDDIGELKKLHKEWFPINYPDNYFERISQDQVIAIGAYYVLNEDEENEVEILLGCIISRIKNYGSHSATSIVESCKHLGQLPNTQKDALEQSMTIW